MHVAYRHFESTMKSWHSMFAEASAFATEVGRDRLIGVSHSHGGGQEVFGAGGSGVVTVWFWEESSSEPET